MKALLLPTRPRRRQLPPPFGLVGMHAVSLAGCPTWEPLRSESVFRRIEIITRAAYMAIEFINAPATLPRRRAVAAPLSRSRNAGAIFRLRRDLPALTSIIPICAGLSSSLL